MFGIIWATRQEIQKDRKISARTMDHRLAEFQEEINKGRYSRYCLERNIGYVRIDYAAFTDFMNNRDSLRDKRLRKYVKPFNRADLIREMQLVTVDEYAQKMAM